MLTAIPVRNPSITECDTNRVVRPSFASPAASIAMPARRVSRARASARSSGGVPSTAAPAASAAAEVVVMTISFVLEVSPPTTGPANAAYKPWTGLTLASNPFAMPPGIAATAPGTPATMSPRSSPRAGRMRRHQARTSGGLSAVIGAAPTASR